MTSVIALPALRAESPAAALAIYGIAQLLAPDGRIGWSADGGGGWHATVSTDECDEAHDLARMLAERIAADSLVAIASIAKDVNELTPETWGDGLEAEGAAIRRAVAGLCSEAPLRDGERVTLTPLCVYSFGTRGTLFGNAAKQDGAISADALHALFVGPWTAKKGINTLGFDPGARRQDGAIMGPDPSADGVRGVPALVPLVLRGLAAVTPMPGLRAQGGAFSRAEGGVEFRWPVMSAAIPAAALPLVVGRDWSVHTPAEREAAGVEAVFGARVLRRERRLSRGRRVA